MWPSCAGFCPGWPWVHSFPSCEAGTIPRKLQSSAAASQGCASYSLSPEVDFLFYISPWEVAEGMGLLGPPDWLQDLRQVAGTSRPPQHYAADKLEINDNSLHRQECEEQEAFD